MKPIEQPDTTTLEGKIAVMQAWLDGKRIQFVLWDKTNPNWSNIDDPRWAWHNTNYRIHPDDLNPPPKYRAWTVKEVPVGALLRYKYTDKDDNSTTVVILGTNKEGAQYVCGLNSIEAFSPDEMFHNREHSLDGGKTWLPCGKMIES